MPRGGLDSQLTGTEVNTLNAPAIFIVIQASDENITGFNFIGINFNDGALLGI